MIQREDVQPKDVGKLHSKAFLGSESLKVLVSNKAHVIKCLRAYMWGVSVWDIFSQRSFC